jgi:hypothetical protein
MERDAVIQKKVTHRGIRLHFEPSNLSISIQCVAKEKKRIIGG